MKSFNDLVAEINEALEEKSVDIGEDVINEGKESSIHPELQKVLDDPINDKRNQKLTKFSKKVKDLISRGEDTGLQHDKPKKGSSRAVFFPKNPRQVEVDGKAVPANTAVKIAFKGKVDPYTEDETLLGQHQNEIETDHFLQQHYSVLSPQGDGKYKTNEHGVIPPVYDSHPDDHWLEAGHSRNMSRKDFKEATKHESAPKGLDFDTVHHHLLNEHREAHGMRKTYNISEEDAKAIDGHPLVDNLRDMMGNMGLHPADFNIDNWGMFKHPVTGKEHPVLRDYGCSDQIAKAYEKARKKMPSKY